MKDFCDFKTEEDRQILRKTFDTQTKLYDEVRPKYPNELSQNLIEVTGISSKSNILEVGIGTGQATEYLLNRGYKVTGVEIGKNLANFVTRKFKNFENFKIKNCSFEDAYFRNHFDLVFFATSFHWIDNQTRFFKTHSLLNDGGHLAVIGTVHVSDGDGDIFFEATKPIYKKHKPGGQYDDSYFLTSLSNVKPEKINKTLFKEVFFKVFPVTIEYSGDDYTRLLATYSPVLYMSQEGRNAFLKDIKNLIDNNFNGKIQKKYGFTLTIAKKI